MARSYARIADVTEAKRAPKQTDETAGERRDYGEEHALRTREIWSCRHRGIVCGQVRLLRNLV